jgi:hypothetical protein
MKTHPISSNDALSCPQAYRLVLPPSPAIGPQLFSSSTTANSNMPALSLSLPPLSSQLAHTTSSQLLSPGSISPSACANFRDRTNSLKRKALDNLAIASAKAIKLTDTLPSLVSQLSDNKVLIDKIGIDVSDEKFADFYDPAIVTILSKLSLSMSGQHKILSNVVSELEGVKMVISDIQNSIANPPATVDMSCSPPPPTVQRSTTHR